MSPAVRRENAPKPPPLRGNLFEAIPDFRDDESVEIIVRTGGARIERIVSRGHASPEGFWYDQEQEEFVLLLRGRAAVRFEGTAEPVTLGPGDYLHIPAHARHRVEWTDPDGETVWLAVHG